MVKYTLLLTLVSIVSLSQTTSIIQEQSQHYKNFHFTNNQQWDSLFALENNKTSIPNASRVAATTSNCNLTKKVYGWHPYWVGSVYTNYDWSLLSEFVYFDYEVSPTTGNNTNASFAWATSPAINAALSNSVAVHFCATMFSGHSAFWASSTAQQTFITNSINLLNTRGGKGLNIDFEGMVASDKVPFKNFMVNLCNQMHVANPNYKVTMALYAVDWSAVFDMPALNAVVDNFVIMGYDYYYSGSSQAGPVAPLYNFQTPYNYTLSRSITYYLNLGATKSKLLLGLPYYGREWETIASTIPSNTTGNFTASRTYLYVRNNPTIYSAANKKWDNNSFTPYYTYVNAGLNRQCFTEDAYSIRRKFDLVNQRGLGGIGIWALGYDDGYNDYWLAIKDKFSNCATTACTDSIYDMGGPNRNHYDNESYVYTIAPTGANKVRLTFKSFDLQTNTDSLYLYDGASAFSPLLGAFTGSVSPGIINSTSSSITLKFKSNATTNRAGFKAIWNCIGDNTSPTTQVNTPSGWITQNFMATYNDADNLGGLGVDKSFYQPSYFNGTEWRANGARGFFNDDFNTTTINNEWTSAVGTWSVSANALTQTDELNGNTNLYAAVTQSLSNRYLYNFKGNISGAGVNRRAGIHIFSGAPALTNRGSGYLVWIRPDQGNIELYEVISNTLTIAQTVSYSVAINTTYDYKITFDRISGELKLWINNIFITTWTDATPLLSGVGVSLRSGNCKFTVDDFKIFRSRPSSNTILAGTSNTNDLRNENSSPNISAGKISSIVKDNADNISLINSQLIDIDWTPPTKPLTVNDGVTIDKDTTNNATQLNLNYTLAKDTNSSITNYYYAIGTTAGAKNILNWTSNSLLTNATQTGLTSINNQKYFIMVKAINGAGLSSDSTVSDGILYLLNTPINTNVNENNVFNSLSIYPNPTNNKTTISIISDTNEKVNYTLIDAQGKLIEEKTLEVISGINNLEINIVQLNLSNGTYLIKLSSLNKIITKKLIIE